MISFERAHAQDLRATFELRVRPLRGCEPWCFAVYVEGGRCWLRPRAPADPDASATISLADLLRLAVGSEGWPALLSGGRLELAGDPFLALRLPMLFRLPLGPRSTPGCNRAASR